MVSSVADRLKISKSDILNPDADDAAVKLALAETHVIQETKKYLEDVRLSSSSLLPNTSYLTLPCLFVVFCRKVSSSTHSSRNSAPPPQS